MTGEDEPRHGFGVACVLTASIFTSSAGILLRWVEAADGWQILFYRSLSFTLLMLGAVVVSHGPRTVAAFRAVGRPGLLVAVGLGVAFCTYVFALINTTVANVVFILSASPFFAAFFAWIAVAEPVRRGLWLTMAVALAGVAIMVGDGMAAGRLAGSLFALVSCVGYAVSLAAFRKQKSVDMLPAVCLAGVVATLGSAVFVEDFAIGSHDLTIAIAMGVVQLGLQYLLITVGARHLPAAEVALLARLQVILAPLWVWIGVGEVPSLYTLIGGAIVLAAVVAQALAALRAPPAISP